MGIKRGEICGKQIIELDLNDPIDSAMTHGLEGVFLRKEIMDRFENVFKAGIESLGIVMYPMEKSAIPGAAGNCAAQIDPPNTQSTQAVELKL